MCPMRNGRVPIGETMEQTAARFFGWHRMERGDAVNEKHVSFENWETMVRVLSPKRLALLRHLHRHPARSIRALSLALNRNYRRVHEVVEALQSAGLLVRDKDGLRAGYDGFDVALRVAL